MSVIVPTYNRADLVRRALSSVLAQTLTDLEVIVVDDASTDRTQRTIGEVTDSRVRYLRHAENRGGAEARNTGIDAASGDFVAFLDSDDEWLPRKLQAQLGMFESSGERIGAVYCAALADRGHGPVPREDTLLRGDVREALLGGWCPPTTSLFVLRREVFESGIRFDPDLPSFQDLDLWLQVSERWEFDYVAEPLVVQHAHGGARVSTDPVGREQALDMLLAKWGEEMRRWGGVEGVEAFRRRHEAAWIYQAALDRARSGARLEALRLVAPLVRGGRLRPGQLLRMTAALTGLYGPLQALRTKLRG